MTPRAIVFDLDDTLYHERRFALSGYQAVAGLIEAEDGARATTVFRLLARSLRRGRRASAFQDVAAALRLPHERIASWLECYRGHAPALKMAPPVRRTLETLRGSWRIGILTNGLPAVQASKVAALGLMPLVDAVVYADGFGGGKPSRAAFVEILSRLSARPGRTVFAGDDPQRDIEGAHRVGMRTVLVDRRGDRARGAGVEADAVVRRVVDVPAAAERLLTEETS
jgi:putative hydrolase of the HAD superfamily